MEPDHQLARGERIVCLALRHTRWRGRARFRRLCRKKNPNSISSCLTLARENARTTREQMSSEMWEQINRLYLFVHSDSGRELLRVSPYEFFKHIVVGSHLFQGITDATMTHGEGWDFIRIGKLLERADCSSRILDVKYHILLPSGEQVGGNVDTIQWMAVLKSCSALEAYRKIYVDQVAPWKVAEFIITHAEFPRSIRFSVDSLDSALHRISGSSEAKYANEVGALVGAAALRSRLRHDRRHFRIRFARIPGNHSGTTRRAERRTPFHLLRERG